ncbi:MAG: hypothetical protein WCK70_10490 [Chloroflexales bacterium]
MYPAGVVGVVEIQSRLARPEIQVVASLEALIAQARHFADS